MIRAQFIYACIFNTILRKSIYILKSITLSFLIGKVGKQTNKKQ